MSYQVYFADLKEENQSLILAILRLKEEAGSLEPGEAEMLVGLRGADYRSDGIEETVQAASELRRATYRRRRTTNGRSPRLNGP